VEEWESKIIPALEKYDDKIIHSNETKTLGCSLIFFMNNNLLEEEKVKLLYTKSIQEKQPPYWVENLKS
jgi:hypothetical protein